LISGSFPVHGMDDSVKETGAKGPEESKEPKSDNAKASDKATKVAELVSCLDDYFEHDANLRKQYEEERPISDLYKLKLVQLQKPDEDTLLSAIKESKKLNLTATGDKVRANIGQGRTILILRDLPRDVQYDQIKKLLESEDLTKQLESRVKEIRPELNDTWFVRFASQEDCMTAFFWLQANGKINGQKVKCRVKSVLQASSYNPGGAGTGPNTNPYADQAFRGYPSPNMYGGYGPGFSPMGMPFPGAYPNYNKAQGGGRGGKRGSRRGRTARSPQGPQGSVPRQNSVGGGAFPRQQSYRQKGRQKSPGMKPLKSPRMKPQKSARQNSKQPVETDDNIYYQGQFVILGRQSFDQIVKSCCNLDMNEPTKPKELLGYPGLLCETPRKAFDMKPVTQGSTAISPMPGAQPSPPEPEAMSLGKAMNEAKKGLEDKMKEVKTFKGNKNKKEAKKAKTDKTINAVQEEESKEEEVLADTAATSI